MSPASSVHKKIKLKWADGRVTNHILVTKDVSLQTSELLSGVTLLQVPGPDGQHHSFRSTGQTDPNGLDVYAEDMPRQDPQTHKQIGERFKPGDQVRSKSSGQSMKVAEDLTKAFPKEPAVYICHWWVGGKRYEGRFAQRHLEPDPPAT